VATIKHPGNKPLYKTLGEAIDNFDMCPNCLGTGTITVLNVRKRVFDGQPIDADMRCPVCNGTGDFFGAEKGMEDKHACSTKAT